MPWADALSRSFETSRWTLSFYPPPADDVSSLEDRLLWHRPHEQDIGPHRSREESMRDPAGRCSTLGGEPRNSRRLPLAHARDQIPVPREPFAEYLSCRSRRGCVGNEEAVERLGARSKGQTLKSTGDTARDSASGIPSRTVPIRSHTPRTFSLSSSTESFVTKTLGTLNG